MSILPKKQRQKLDEALVDHCYQVRTGYDACPLCGEDTSTYERQDRHALEVAFQAGMKRGLKQGFRAGYES